MWFSRHCSTPIIIISFALFRILSVLLKRRRLRSCLVSRSVVPEFCVVVIEGGFSRCIFSVVWAKSRSPDSFETVCRVHLEKLCQHVVTCCPSHFHIRNSDDIFQHPLIDHGSWVSADRIRLPHVFRQRLDVNHHVAWSSVSWSGHPRPPRSMRSMEKPQVQLWLRCICQRHRPQCERTRHHLVKFQGICNSTTKYTLIFSTSRPTIRVRSPPSRIAAFLAVRWLT